MTQPPSSADQAADNIRTIRIASCASLSGKSTLTYHIGCTPDGKFQLRIFANIAAGMFSQRWTSLESIFEHLEAVPKEQTIASSLLHPLYTGTSINTAAFVFAVLKQEGVVGPAKNKARQYERLDPQPFLSALQALVASGVDLFDGPPASKPDSIGSHGVIASGKGKASVEAERYAPPIEAKSQGKAKSKTVSKASTFTKAAKKKAKSR